MSKKTLIVAVADGMSPVTELAAFAGVEMARFERMFDIEIVTPVATGIKRAAKDPTFLDRHQQPCIVAIGKHTADFLGMPGSLNATATVVKGGQIRLGVILDISKPKRARDARALVRDLVAMNTPPVTHEDAQKVIAIVKQTPEIGYYTNKIITEIEAKMDANKEVDRWDLVQLTECWANDVKIGEGL